MTGNELEAWRKKLGLSRKAAAALLDCAPNYLYDMERRGRRISQLRATMCWLLEFPKVREGVCQRIKEQQSYQKHAS